MQNLNPEFFLIMTNSVVALEEEHIFIIRKNSRQNKCCFFPFQIHTDVGTELQIRAPQVHILLLLWISTRQASPSQPLLHSCNMGIILTLQLEDNTWEALWLSRKYTRILSVWYIFAFCRQYAKEWSWMKDTNFLLIVAISLMATLHWEVKQVKKRQWQYSSNGQII